MIGHSVNFSQVARYTVLMVCESLERQVVEAIELSRKLGPFQMIPLNILGLGSQGGCSP